MFCLFIGKAGGLVKMFCFSVKEFLHLALKTFPAGRNPPAPNPQHPGTEAFLPRGRTTSEPGFAGFAEAGFAGLAGAFGPRGVH